MNNTVKQFISKHNKETIASVYTSHHVYVNANSADQKKIMTTYDLINWPKSYILLFAYIISSKLWVDSSWYYLTEYRNKFQVHNKYIQS